MDISKQGILAGKELIGADKFSETIFIQNTDLKFDEMYFRLCERFDHIIALSVFNHNPIDNFEEFIENVHKIIHENTQIFLTYLEFPNNKTHIRIPDHIKGEERDNWEGYRGVDFPYSFNDVQNICTQNDFTVVKIDMTKKYWKKIPLPLLKMVRIMMR